MFELAATLPDTTWCAAPDHNGATRRSRRRKEVDAFVGVYNALDFGWRYVGALKDAREPLPYELEPEEEALYRAYLHQCGIGDDPELRYAIWLDSPEGYFQASMIQGLLLERDASWGGVARHLRLPVGVIMLYEQLFFNVLDRKCEPLFIAKLVFPQGRIGALALDLDRFDVRAILRRAGYENGAKDVLWAAGLTREFPQEALDASRSAKELEKRILFNSLMMAKNGFLHDREKMRDGIAVIVDRKKGERGRPTQQCEVREDDMAECVMAHVEAFATG